MTNKDIWYEIIGSSSKGNCIVVNDYFMLDCGVSYSKIKNKLFKVKMIFISHTHKDHLLPSTIKKIAFEHPNIKYIVGNYLVDNLLKCGVQKKNIIVLDIDKWYKVGTLLIKLDELEHDVKNCCIHIVFENGKKLLYAVDTSTLDNIVAKNYDLYLVEGNYDEEEITKREEEKRLNGEYVIETRIRNSHLSKQKCNEWLFKNIGDNSEFVYCHEHIESEKKL